MRITWTDGAVTLATIGAVVVERAHFHDWTWPLISSVRWTILIISALAAISILVSFVIDKIHSKSRAIIATIFASLVAVITGLGIYFNASDYIVLLMLTIVAFWAVSIVRHFVTPASMTHYHAS